MSSPEHSNRRFSQNDKTSARADTVDKGNDGAHWTRRSFLAVGFSSLAGISVIPRSVLGGAGFVPPSDKINIACIGVGSQGYRVMLDFLRFPDVQVLAVCDANKGSGNYVEWGDGELRNKTRELLGDSGWGKTLSGAWAGIEPAKDVVEKYYALQKQTPAYHGCKTYVDYRELLEKEPDVDAVVIGTPDHLHAPVSIHAMKRGKHVFCQKPMAHTVAEARRMAEVARDTGVATQVATGNSASEATRLLAEWIDDGAIGAVREVHNWSSRPFWPQGIDRPTESMPIPEYLNWDLWLGPAPERPFHSIYQPFVWRGWFDFGAGAVGDMGCYSFDTLFRVLQLTAPERIEASTTPVFQETYPLASTYHFHFPERGNRPAVTIHWYDGGIRPSTPDELERTPLDNEGMLYVGDRGKILCQFEGGEPRLIPESAMKAYQQPARTLPRSIGHYEEWIEACKGGPKPAANFEFAGRVTETILLGNVAARSGKTIYWDASAMRITEPGDANALLDMAYRDGWMV